MCAGRYRLVAPLGSGSIGAVWSAHDEESDRLIALKLVVFGGDSQREARFLREAKATMRLKSPHVVNVFDAGTFTRDSGQVGFLAMERLVGHTLEEMTQPPGRLPKETVLWIFEQVGRAVSLAHSLGLIHRDLKPANVFICNGQVAKVLDLGLTKSFAAPLTPRDGTLTRVGDVIGTPLYMSPEQARGSEAIDHRTDLWALGVMVFEALIGFRPFKARTLTELITVLEEVPIVVPSSIADVPAGFDAWFHRAVHRDVQCRFQSASAMMAELAQTLAPERTRRGPMELVESVLAAHRGVMSADGTPHAVDGDQRTVRRLPGTALVGREGWLGRIDEAFAEHARVVTLCGERGVGRSALSMAHAIQHTHVDGYVGGAWRCSFAGVGDADAMWRRVADGLGCELGDEDAGEQAARAVLHLGRALVILERVERVRELVAHWCRDLLRTAPLVRVIVTSDQPLHIATERVFEVGGLAVAVAGQSQPQTAPACRLLLDPRSDAPSVSLARQAEELATVAKGHPLALRLAGLAVVDSNEVAANALFAQAAAEIAKRPQHGDHIVLSGAACLAAHLPEHEHAVFVQMSCFRAPFTSHAVERVARTSSGAAAEAAEGLSARGFVERVHAGGELRFAMHPVMRKLGTSLLAGWAKDDALALFERHGEFFATRGDDDGVDALRRRGGASLLSIALADAEDVSAAASRAQKRREMEVAARCSVALGVLEQELGRHGVAARLYLTAMSSFEPGSRRFTAAACLRIDALVAGDRLHPAWTLAEQVARKSPPAEAEPHARALLALATCHLADDEPEEANAVALEARSRGGRLDIVADADLMRARAGAAQAGELAESARATYHTLGESRLEAAACRVMGDLDAALAIERRLGARKRVAETLLERARASSDPHTAERDRQEAAILLSELGADFGRMSGVVTPHQP